MPSKASNKALAHNAAARPPLRPLGFRQRRLGDELSTLYGTPAYTIRGLSEEPLQRLVPVKVFTHMFGPAGSKPRCLIGIICPNPPFVKGYFFLPGRGSSVRPRI